MSMRLSKRRLRAGIAPALLLLVLIMRVASSASAGACYLVLSIYALGSERNAIRALALAWLMTMWNPTLGPVPAGASVGRFVVIGAAALSCLLRWRSSLGGLSVSSVALWSFALGAFFVVHSLLFSELVAVSLLKAISWTVTMVTLVTAWTRVRKQEHEGVIGDIRNLLLFVALASFPFLAMSQGYARNGSGFQGILNHPQALGPTMAILASLTLSEVLMDRRPTFLQLAVLTLSVGFVLASEARTAGFAMLFGSVLAALIFSSGSTRQRLGIFVGLRSRRVIVALGLGLLLGLFQAGRVERGLKGFVGKRGGPTQVIEAYESSRGPLIAEMWKDFLKEPIFGSGFGLPGSSKRLEVAYDPATGLPTAAPVEKGVLPLSVLEELGVVGFVAVGVWVWGGIRRSAVGGLTSFMVVLTCLLTNLGEATLFSPGGMGLLIMICVSWGFSFPASILRDDHG